MLLFGADLVCLTWATTGLDKRLAIKTLCCIGTSLRQQIAVWLLVATVLSIFLPNVVVCTILVPVAVSMLQFIGEENIKTVSWQCRSCWRSSGVQASAASARLWAVRRTWWRSAIWKS